MVSVSLNPFLPMKAGTLFNGKLLVYLSSDSLSSTISTSNLRYLAKPTVTSALGVNVATYRVLDIAHELTFSNRCRNRVVLNFKEVKNFSSDVERKKCSEASRNSRFCYPKLFAYLFFLPST